MKKSQFFKIAVILLFAFGTFNTASAQLQKGSWMVGGYANLGLSRSTTTFSIAPSAGYFFRPKTAFGTALQIDYRRFSPGPNDPVSFTALGLNPYIRHYFLPAENKINIFGQVGGSLLAVSQSNGANSLYTSLNLGLGVSYFITPRLALELKTTYSPQPFANLNIPNFNLNTRLGFQIFF